MRKSKNVCVRTPRYSSYNKNKQDIKKQGSTVKIAHTELARGLSSRVSRSGAYRQAHMPRSTH